MRYPIFASRRVIAAAVLLTMGCQNLDRYGNATTLDAPFGLRAASGGTDVVALEWERPAGLEGKMTYRLFRNGMEVNTTELTEHRDAGLSASTTYIYTVSAVDRVGHQSPMSTPASATTWDEGTADTTAPSVPLDLTAGAASSSRIVLSWTASTDASGVLGYRVYRDGGQIAVTGSPGYTDIGLAASTEYTYTVAAYDGAGNQSAQSAPASATTLAEGESDTEAPTAPTGLTAVAASPNDVALSWNPSTDNVGVVGYDIYRDGNLVASTVTTAWTDTALCAATDFIYTVRARDAAGNISDPSDPAGVTTLQVAVDLGSAADFSVLAGSGISLTGLLPSNISGDVGTSPSNSLTGGLLLNLLSGALHLGDGTAAMAQVDFGSAYNGLLAQPVCSGNTIIGQQLGGLTLDAGVHALTSDANLTGTLTLDAEGDPNAVFVIKVPGSLSVANNATAALTGGAQPENVYWVVEGSTTAGSGATIAGNLLTVNGATFGLGTNVDGRVLARTGAVSLLVNTIGL